MLLISHTYTSRHDGDIEPLDVPTAVPADYLKDLMKRCYQSEIMVDGNKAQSIQAATRDHSYDDNVSVVWQTERRRRITSTNARSIAKRRSTTPVNRLVHQLLYSTFRGTSATRWGLQQEEHSVGAYMSWLNDRGSPRPTVDINCGLSVCTAHPWLAATPDGWVTDPEVSPSNGLVEFKNPYSYRDLAVSDAITANKCDCLKIANGRIQLKRTHSYYYQVQVAMLCTNTQWCDFLLRTTVDFHCERVEYDEAFCIDMIPTLRRFYIIAILPELSLKGKSIREPKDWIDDEHSFVLEMEQLVS